ncbi:MAG: phosphoribosyltransferase [Burkholderiales bacterium]|nr:phosphoribosyltransferase [Burkholderiales bacterium]
MTDLVVGWDDYHRAIEDLAAKVAASGWKFDGIVCIARGGLRVGDALARIFKVPLAIIAASSYTGEAGTVRGAITVAEHMTMTAPRLGERLLLVDDLVDSGVTLDVVKRHLLARHREVKEVRTAVLWHKACSQVVPDFAVARLADSPWIRQPFERYDLMQPADLVGRAA